MKKVTSSLLLFLVISCAIADDNSSNKIKFKGETGFESEYVNRGRKLGQQISSTNLNFSTKLGNGDLHFGTKIRHELDASYTSGKKVKDVLGEQFEASFSVVTAYINYVYDINDTFTMTAGYMHYYYPRMDDLNKSFYNASSRKAAWLKTKKGVVISPETLGVADNTNEIFVGGWANVIFRPTLLLAYNFDCKEFSAEGHAFIKKTLECIGAPKLTFFMDMSLGYSHADKPYGIDWNNLFWSGDPIPASGATTSLQSQFGKINGHKGYVYGGVKAHLIYALNANSDLRVGANYATNGNNGKSWTNFTGWGSNNGVKHMMWWNASIDCRF